jgi:cobaltochelatase CobS
MNQYVPVPLSVFGLPGDVQVPGRMTNSAHPFLRRVMPFAFSQEIFRVLQFAWLREVNRQPHQPRRGVWLSGPKGAGKTTVIEQFFARLGIPIASLTCNREFRIADAVQSKTLVPNDNGGMTIVPVDGPLGIAMRDGFPVVLNELDLADPAELTGLNDIVDRGFYVVPDSGEVIEAAAGFMVMAAANSNGSGDLSGEYAGVATMNSALMSRFYKFEVGYPSRADELEILRQAGVVSDENETVAEKVCEIADLLRKAYRSGSNGLTTPISTREVIDITEAVGAFAHLVDKNISPMKYAFALCYGNGLPPPARKAVEEVIDRVAA